MSTFEKAMFCLDSLPDTAFSGYTRGDVWNGFACPLFEQAEAEQVLEASKANRYTWVYSAETDTYLVRHADDAADYEADEFKGQDLAIEGRDIRLYGIGTYSWSWRIYTGEQFAQ